MSVPLLFVTVLLQKGDPNAILVFQIVQKLIVFGSIRSNLVIIHVQCSLVQIKNDALVSELSILIMWSFGVRRRSLSLNVLILSSMAY